jgi:hypothetical protein
MNKRIEELALQCGAWHQVYDQKRFMVDRHFDVEKFAELIVQECIDTYDHWATHSMDKTAFIVAKTQVKKHFGIEQ